MSCEVCGKEDVKIINSRKYGKKLCRKHYSQMSQYGKILLQD